MITDFKEEDINDILLLSDKYVGENFQTYNSIKTYLTDPKKILKVYKVNDEIIGFIKGEILEKGNFKKLLLKTNANIEEKLADEENIGVAETICVKKSYRGTKVAMELTDELIHSFKELEHIDSVCSLLWKTTEGANAQKLVEKIGFKFITEISGFWYNDSMALNYKCPKCGNPPCKCTMMFYKL